MSPPTATSSTSPSSRWLALTTRLPSAHSLFVYCVLTTRIYCRPTCPSRLARRANVIFHDTAADAAAAGFRPCKRCKPEVEGWESGGEVVARAKKMMREGTRGLGELSEGVGMSRSHFLRVFKGLVGCTPREWAEKEGRRIGHQEEGERNTEVLGAATAGRMSTSWLKTCSEDIGSLKDSLLGAEANVSDVWLLDVPMTAYSTSEKESFSMNSTTEDWDLYFNDLSLPLRDDSAPEVGPIESLNADTPTEVEPLTPSDHMADVAIPTEPCSPLGQDAFGDGELWWQPPTIDWDVGVGSTLLDANATIAGFESPGCSHEREQRLYVDRGSERLRSPSTKPMF